MLYVENLCFVPGSMTTNGNISHGNNGNIRHASAGEEDEKDIKIDLTSSGMLAPCKGVKLES